MNSIIIQGIEIEDFKSIIQDCIRKEISSTSSNENPPANDLDQLLKIEDVQKLLNVSKVTIHKWKKDGILPYLKLNRALFFNKSEILNALKSINYSKKRGG